MNARKKKTIEELLRRELSNILLFELKDPRTGFLTVTRAELSRDQRSARVFLTVRPAEELARTLATLTRARGYVQRLIADRLKLRYTPVLSFAEDDELRHTERLEHLIDEARRDDTEDDLI